LRPVGIDARLNYSLKREDNDPHEGESKLEIFDAGTKPFSELAAVFGETIHESGDLRIATRTKTRLWVAQWLKIDGGEAVIKIERQRPAFRFPTPHFHIGPVCHFVELDPSIDSDFELPIADIYQALLAMGLLYISCVAKYAGDLYRSAVRTVPEVIFVDT
jgi:hypothetical protein